MEDRDFCKSLRSLSSTHSIHNIKSHLYSFLGQTWRRLSVNKLLQVGCIILYICTIHFSVLDLSASLTEHITMVTMGMNCDWLKTRVLAVCCPVPSPWTNSDSTWHSTSHCHPTITIKISVSHNYFLINYGCYRQAVIRHKDTSIYYTDTTITSCVKLNLPLRRTLHTMECSLSEFC
jgi:hypothetical protein